VAKFIPKHGKHDAQLLAETETIEALVLENEGYNKLWEAAINRQDGFAEQESRMRLHAILDQLLDLRMRILQLSRKSAR